MYETYKNEFIKAVPQKDKYIYFACFNKINGLNKPVRDWNDTDFDNLLTSMESISANSIRKYIVVFREIHKYICAKEGAQCKRLQPTKPVFDYIRYPKLRARILTYDDYRNIRTLLTFYENGQEYNFRDKIMFELAWEGLSNSEIRYLKVSDIEWIKDKDDDKKAFKAKITLSDGRELIIDDGTVVKDLGAAVNEQIYARLDKNGKILFYPYRNSQYLIKPISITTKMKNTDDDSVSNPSLMLRQVLNKIAVERKIISKDANGQEVEIELGSLNLEDIRRSKIIYMLALNKYLSVGDIARLFGKNVECDYYWLKEVSNRVYT